MSDELIYPSSYTEFFPKKNAEYEGDTNGDYVMAEDINQLQEAIQRVEQAIGLYSSGNKTINERINDIASIQELKTPEHNYFYPTYPLSDTTNTIQKLSRYSQVSLSPHKFTSTLIPKLKLQGTKAFITVDTGTNKFSNIDAETISKQYQSTGIDGIVLYNFGKFQSTRSVENEIITAIRNLGLEIVIHSSEWEKLFSTNKAGQYNPEQETLALGPDTTLMIPNFAYYGNRQYFGSEMDLKMAPFLEARKKMGSPLIGISQIESQIQYSYAQMYGLIYSLDGIYFGPWEFSQTAEEKIFNFPKYLGSWQTKDPILFATDNSIERVIKGGKLVINKDMSVRFDGMKIQMNDIEWMSQSLLGKYIKDGTLSPAALSSYDINKIIQLLNTEATIKIDPKMIDSENGGSLPINIPWTNMKENVIEAINKKNDINSTETQRISDNSIKNLVASKLEGDISKEQMQRNVVLAVNSSSVDINVRHAQIEDLNTTTITSTVINSEQATFQRANVTETITAAFVEASNSVTSYEAFLDYVTSLIITTDVLRAKTLEVDNLQADNIKAVVIEAVTAEITNGTFQSIVTQYLQSAIIKTDLITAINSMVGEAVMDGALIQEGTIINAHIVNVSANKLTAGTIDTGLVTISGTEGYLQIQDNAMKIYDKVDVEGTRRKRVQIGDVSEVLGQSDKYGLVVMGADGTTVLYDHSGVYNEGIKNNAISNEKIQEDAVDSRVIMAGQIFSKHITSEAVTTEHIATGAITAVQLAANCIVAGSAVIAEGAIGSAQISELHGSKIIAETITSEHLRSASITGDKLLVGYQNNLIKNSLDSFEQCDEGKVPGRVLSGAENSKVIKRYPYSGEKSLLIMGNSANNTVILNENENLNSSKILIGIEDSHIISTYVTSPSMSGAQVSIGVRRYKQNGEFIDEWSATHTTSRSSFIRPFLSIEPLADYPYLDVLLRTSSANVEVYFDAIQVERAMVNQKDPGWYRSNETTMINGSNVTTGRIDAKYIKIGSGTKFGEGEIITLSDEGILVAAKTGEVTIDGDGISIKGGAFNLLNEGKVKITGTDGLSVWSPRNTITVNPTLGILIRRNIDNETIFNTDLEGNVFVKGRIEVTESNSIYNKTETDSKIDEVNKSLEEAQRSLTTLAEKTSVSIGMKMGYSTFNTVNSNCIYFCGLQINGETYIEELHDINGRLRSWDSSVSIEVPKQKLDLTNSPKVKGYIVYDNTKEKIYFIYLNDSEKWIAHNLGQPNDKLEFIFNESTFVIGNLDLRT